MPAVLSASKASNANSSQIEKGLPCHEGEVTRFAATRASAAASVLSLNQILSSTATPEASESLTRTRTIAQPAARRNATTVSWLVRSRGRLMTTIAPVILWILNRT